MTMSTIYLTVLKFAQYYKRSAGCANFSTARNIIRAQNFVVVKIKRAFKIPTRTKTFIVCMVLDICLIQ
jgi:hypothetical protein